LEPIYALIDAFDPEHHDDDDHDDREERAVIAS
jgi:hypothetical protein